MRLRRHRAASVATGTLASLVLAACGGTDIASSSSGGDRILPAVTIEITSSTGDGADSVSVRQPMKVHIVASDNAGLSAVVTRVFLGTVMIHLDSIPTTVKTYDRVVDIPLSGVRSGQLLTVAVEVSDASGNAAEDLATAVAFDPSGPQLALLAPQTSVIPAGTYGVKLSVTDSVGITKVGYTAIGAGINRSDSTVFSAPQPKSDTVDFRLSVPSNAPVGGIFTVTPFAENVAGLRVTGGALTVRVLQAGADEASPLVFQTVPPRLETPDSIEITARDADGLVRIVGFIAKNTSGIIVHRSADTLTSPAQQITRQKAFLAPTSLRGQTLFITAYATDVAGHTGYAVPTGATVPITSDSVARRDPTVYAYGLTFGMASNSLGADIAVDTVRSTVYVSDINRNELRVWNYGTTLTPRPAVSVGSMPWGMAIDNSGSLLLVANSGGTNISKVNLISRLEEGRVKTANEYIFDVSYSKDPNSGGFRFTVSAPIDYSDRPQFIAQSASGALYYSTRPTSAAEPGTLRKLDNFLDTRNEPRQIWQYASFLNGHYAIINADAVDVIKGQNGVPDEIIICDHKPGNLPTTATCVTNFTVEGAVAALRAAPTNGNVEAVKDIDVESLALPDTNFVAVGGDRRRVMFGEANSGGRAGRVMLVLDPAGTPADGAQYSAPMEIVDLTNNASDRVFGVDINRNSSNFAVHGIESFFADSSLRLQGKYATFNTGAGIAFHPRNVDEATPDSLARVAFVASGDNSIQIVDSYSYRLRGRIPIRENLYGPLRAVEPTAAERAADPSLVVKLFGLTPEGLVVIDVRRADIDNARVP